MPISKKREKRGKGKAYRKQKDPDFKKLEVNGKKKRIKIPVISKNISTQVELSLDSPIKSILVKDSKLKKIKSKKETKIDKDAEIILIKKVKFKIEPKKKKKKSNKLTDSISQTDKQCDMDIEIDENNIEIYENDIENKFISDTDLLEGLLSNSSAIDGDEEEDLGENEFEKFSIAKLENESPDTWLQEEDEKSLSMDLNELKTKVEGIVNVLNNFNRMKAEIKKPRKFFLSLLVQHLARLYGYNRFLMEQFVRLVPLDQLIEFLDWNDKERPITIRANTLKISAGELLRSLKHKKGGVLKCDKLTFGQLQPSTGEIDSKSAKSPQSSSSIKEDPHLIVVYESAFSLGATPEYLGGLYAIQGTASALAASVLAPAPGQRVLDLCAAPGGKTCHLAAIMKNKGTIFANDVNADRVKAISSNCNRMGVVNTIITNYDGREYPKVMRGFDRALVDAPCMGTGVISKDSSVKINKDEISLRKCTKLQRELLLAAIDCIDPKSDGIIVYSTCSLLVDENELVIDYVMRKRKIKILPTGLDVGNDAFTKFREHRFHPDMKYCRRLYPHIHNTDGFFIAKLRKIYQKPEPEKPSDSISTKSLTTKKTDSNVKARLIETKTRKRFLKKGSTHIKRYGKT
ncbi:unnamed protein product [Gordionus sp. m RMFG-2023]